MRQENEQWQRTREYWRSK